MKTIKLQADNKTMTLGEAIKDLFVSTRIIWRMRVSDLLMIKLHTKVLKYLIYLYKTKEMLYDNPDLYLIHDMYKNNPNLKYGAKHEFSFQVLRNSNKYFEKYFEVIKEQESSENSNGSSNQ